MFLKGIMAIALVLAFAVPGAYGISMSISGGEGGGSFYDITTFDALAQDNLIVRSVVNGATLEQDASGSGDLRKSFGISNRRGERAHITADVVNAGSWEYSQPVMVADATTASVTGFALTATDANSIKCNAEVSDRRGDKASAVVEVIQGSLYNYHGDAFASSSGVNAMQSFDSAVGAQITAKEVALKPAGSAATNTKVQNGGIIGYSNLGLTSAGSQSAGTFGQFELAIGSMIATESSASRSCGYRSNTKMDIAGTKAQMASVSGYNSVAGFGSGFETEAEQNLFGVASGKTIELLAASSNAERDISSLKTDILGTETEPGFISEYSDIAESFRDNVFANSVFSQAEADEIHLSSSSLNKRNDRANANMNAAGNGLISSYEGFSSASAKTASANTDILNIGILAGKNIEYDVSVSDAKRNSATISNEVRDGSIFGDVTNRADISPNELVAAQVGDGVSGSLMQLKFDAREAATKETVHNSIDLPNLSNFNYFITLGVNR